MTRPAFRRIAACLATGALTTAVSAGLFQAAPAASADTDRTTTRTPLKVSIQTLSPSTVPARGRVTITGTITNRSRSTWRDMRVYMLTSARPMTTTEELAEASASDPTAVVGSRLIGPGLYDEVPDLPPGGSAPYQLSVPRRDLGIGSEPGVYWIGVHVLGADQTGHDEIADGRARTFVPLMRPTSPGTSMSLVMPVKAQVERTPDGKLDNEDALAQSLLPEGRLGRLLELSGTATQALTWILDPAVVSAAQSVSQGNPPIDTGPTAETSGPSPDSSPTPSTSPSSSPTDSPTDSPTGNPTGSPTASPTAGTSAGSTDDSDSATSPAARGAGAWVQELKRQSSTHAVMAVPYGDLDVAAALDNGFSTLFRQAVDLSTQTMAGIDVQASTLVAPPDGYLSRKALAGVGPDRPVLLSDAAFPRASGSVLRLSGSGNAAPPVVLTDTAASSGGPSPGRSFSALAVRQRILSDAALHALSPGRDQAMVVSTPQSWNPGTNWQDAQFFSGLSVPWLHMIDLPSLLSTNGGTSTGGTSKPDKATPVFPAAERKAEVPFSNLLASQRLVHAGALFAGLLTRNDTVDDELAKAAMLGSSSYARKQPYDARLRVTTTTHQVHGEMRKVRIDGPPFVVMSSESGTILVTIINGLDESVSVGIRADTADDQLAIAASGPITLGPRQRTPVRLKARAKSIGVHPVTLVPVNSDGQPIGSLTRFTVRSSQVGLVIWVIMGVGAAILFTMIGVRILRRVSRRKRTHGPLLQEPGA